MNTGMTMYVLVRLDLSDSYRMAQGTHAVVQYALEQTELFTKWDNGRIVFLGVYGIRGIKDWFFDIAKVNIPLVKYEEPDLDNQPTAIACVVNEIDYDVFDGLKCV
jgi:hypothetical protein